MTKPKPKTRFTKPSKRAEEIAMQRLRYMSAANVVKDHRSPEARAAIEAVLMWVGLNAVVGWTGKDRRITTNAMRRRHLITDEHDVVVIGAKHLDEAEKILVPKRRLP